MNTLQARLHRKQRTEALKLTRQLFTAMPNYPQPRSVVEAAALRLIKREALRNG